ncbi:MFS family permease [Kribbella aluminosa]|uniref:MFS family permease n=1 Tax=Kribbella aluminosa TaxID=416017 RepID=A0ABS4UJE5_9ACTN|nr:MFS transporter [Kribbella aluminosa]MBP2351771.1 MFS family permease [Kribbella aluminosa]
MFGGWRTGLSGPVIVLQAGTAVNYFGTGLVLPFEIIYLHQARGFPTATAGLVLAAVMATAAVVTPPSGALLDRFRAKPILITGNLASALGYAGFAFVDRPWQAFVCSAVGGAGFGVASTANQVLSLTLVSAEQRASSIALRRVAGNFGLGSGATVAGFIIASANDLRAFQALYLVDGATFGVFALVVLVGIPNPRLANAAPASGRGTGFRAVAHDRLFLILIAANIVLTMTGGAFFSNILPPFAKAHTPIGPGEIGIVIFINTILIVVAQIPATRVVKRMRRTHALAATSALFAIGLLAVLLATLTSSTLTATTVLVGVAIVIAIGECAQFIVLGPIVADLAPPHLLGRYLSLYGLTFMAGVALGPAVGGPLLATSPDAVWWGGALAAALTGAGVLRLGNRIPDPLLPTQCPPP